MPDPIQQLQSAVAKARITGRFEEFLESVEETLLLLNRCTPADGRHVFLERLMNHKFCYDAENKIVLQDETVWSTDVAHQKWLFKHDNPNSFANYNESHRGAIEEPVYDRPGTPHQKQHPGKPIVQSQDRSELIQARIHAGNGLDFFSRGPINEDTGEYRYDDIYGLVRAKLAWTSQHSNEHSILNVLKFLQGEIPAQINGLFPDENAQAWTDLASYYTADEPGMPDWDDVKEQFHGDSTAHGIDKHGTY